MIGSERSQLHIDIMPTSTSTTIRTATIHALYNYCPQFVSLLHDCSSLPSGPITSATSVSNRAQAFVRAPSIANVACQFELKVLMRMMQP